ncbi:hypothetical protein DFA_06381 [Cavenderia fasciculata]|uniref:Uncharacterized protein n=1 Tax=Cavenderia fasciculata TaxID=261658 RepID=F4PKV9_CACFS|nr:uncharacterized protein DFA_06381 [Cavenderia fasciculata]EGG24233.1 hypothetical protein DFA_06381 [Cavenderia fasciculata]|eukprot:XP_004362084.1 hypothetical protein DFA_06381 [Cavenderia fasciculata]
MATYFNRNIALALFGVDHQKNIAMVDYFLEFQYTGTQDQFETQQNRFKMLVNQAILYSNSYEIIEYLYQYYLTHQTLTFTNPIVYYFGFHLDSMIQKLDIEMIELAMKIVGHDDLVIRSNDSWETIGKYGNVEWVELFRYPGRPQFGLNQIFSLSKGAMLNSNFENRNSILKFCFKK